MSYSRIFLYFCLAFVGGIFLGSIIAISQLLLLGFFIFGMILITVFWPRDTAIEMRKNLVIIGFCLLFLATGIWRYNLAESQTQSANNEFNQYLNQEIIFTGKVLAPPDIRENSSKLRVRVDEIGGEVLITVNRYPEYKYGDKLKIIGKLEAPPIFEGFNYQNYLQKEGIYFVINRPKIEKLGENFGNPFTGFLFSFKNKFQESVGSLIAPPQEGLLEALVFGDESNISQEWKQKFNITGLRHIAAVSGMNITIIASLILSFALSLGLWRQQAFYLSLFLLVIYILMIGAPASAVRAGIMAGILMLAQHTGRLSAAPRAVTFAAVLMLLINPFLLKWDVGFQLSFLAILGLIFLQPNFLGWMKIIPNPKFFPIRSTLSATLSAQVFTMPILIFNFGYISLISPIANILIVSFLAPITILIFIFGAAALIWQPLGWIFSWPVWFSLTYIIKIIDWFSQLSFATLSIKDIHWGWLLVFYLILGYLVWRMKERERLKFLEY